MTVVEIDHAFRVFAGVVLYGLALVGLAFVVGCVAALVAFFLFTPPPTRGGRDARATDDVGAATRVSTDARARLDAAVRLGSGKDISRVRGLHERVAGVGPVALDRRQSYAKGFHRQA